MTVWAALARLIGCREDQAEELLASPEHARQAELRISRRGLFLGVGAVAGGSAFSFADPFDDERARVLRMAQLIVGSYMDALVGVPVQSYVVTDAQLRANRVLNVTVSVRPLGYIIQPITTELEFK